MKRARISVFCAITLGLILGVGVTQIFLRHVGHDQAWLLYAANLVLDGVVLNGPKLIETNPPFVVWFHLLPVLLGRLLHVGYLDGFRILFDSVAVGSLVWTAYLLRRLLHVTGFLLWLLVCAQIVIEFLVIGVDSLGQREHFLVLLLLPYLIAVAGLLGGEVLGGAQQALVGIAAAMGVALKPQHVLVILFAEALLLWRTRRWRNLLRPTVVSLVLCGMGYFAANLIWGKTYFSLVVPMMRQAYWGFNVPYSQVMRKATFLLVVAVLVVCAAVQFRRRSRMPRSMPPSMSLGDFAAVLTVAVAASASAYVQQHKGWSYQLIPAALFTLLLLIVLAAEAFQGHTTRVPLVVWGSREWVAALLVFGLTCAVEMRFGHRAGYVNVKKMALNRMFAAYPSGTAVGFISTEPWEMPIVPEQQKVLGQRFVHFWLLPAIVHSQDPQRAGVGPTSSQASEGLAAFQRQATAEDLASWRPAMVVIDQRGPELADALQRESYPNLLAWFLKAPAFQREWRHYVPAGREGDLEAFRRVD